MTLWRGKRGWRWLAVAILAVGAVAGWWLWKRNEERYVPGAGAQGLFDSLGRRLPDDRPAVRFTDVTAQSGIAFRHFPATRTNRLPEDMGSGVALGDADGDGWTDVFLVNTARSLEPSSAGGGRCALFRNRGDGTFEDVSRAAGADVELFGMGAAFLDHDSDGDLDLLITSYGGLTLLANDGGAHFRDAPWRPGSAASTASTRAWP